MLVRSAAAFSLGEPGNPSAVGPLLQALEAAASTPEFFRPEEVRVGIVTALGQLGDTSAVEPLTEWIIHPSFFVRKAAAGSFGSLGDERACPSLIAMLNDDMKEVRREAAQSLGRLSNEAAVGPLLQAVEDGRLRARDVTQPLDLISGRWRKGPAADGLVRKLHKRLGGAHALGVQFQSAEDLGEIENDRAIAILDTALLRRNAVVLTGAYRYYIRKLSSPAIPALIEALDAYGDLAMANDYLRYGDRRLMRAARNWARYRNLALLSDPRSD